MPHQRIGIGILTKIGINKNFEIGKSLTIEFVHIVMLLRKRLSDLEQRLNGQHLEERLAALQDLELRKNRELEASKIGWEDQIKQLSSQVCFMVCGK